MDRNRDRNWGKGKGRHMDSDRDRDVVKDLLQNLQFDPHWLRKGVLSTLATQQGILHRSQPHVQQI